MPETDSTSAGDSEQWFALTVKPKQELTASAALHSKGIERFVPTYIVRRSWSDRIKTFTEPLFPGYVFCHTTMAARGQVLKTIGVRNFVSVAGAPAAIPDAEIEAIQCMTTSGFPIEPLDYLRIGEPVRVIAGPLRGVTGILSKREGRDRIVVGIEMLQRSVSVAIDRTELEPLRPTNFQHC